MTSRNIATLIIFLALIGVGIYWFVTRPTPEEKVLKEFLDEFHMGHYIEAQDFTLNNDFYEMAASSSVRDTDGSEYLIRDYFPKSRRNEMQFSIETYVRFHIAKWKYLPMTTEDVEDGHSVVHFRLEIAIRDTRSGNLLGEVYEGKVEGNAHMGFDRDEWAIQSFDFNIFSDEGFLLATYLERYP